MNRRQLLETLASATALFALPSCAVNRTGALSADGEVMTVRGRINSREMGVTLTHEHLLASFQPHEEWARRPLPYDRDEVVEVALPYLRRIRELGCRTLVDATAVGLGRDAVLLRRLSQESGLHILATTGNYAAFENRFLPPYVFSNSAEALADRWIGEWNNGIDGTEVRPGFIKLGFNGGSLSEVERKLIRAGAIAHLRTGMTIGAHTGPAVAAFEQLAMLQTAGVDPSAWIWIHAQNEKDPARHAEAARRGAWVSFDGVGPDSIDAHLDSVMSMRSQGLLHRTLVSQDAGWYSVGEPRGGDFRAFDTVFTTFIPALRARGLSQVEIDTLFIANPANAFAIRVRQRVKMSDV
jgi:predicted metal-dependent phosphotriesterase family hydrolase